MEKLLNELNVLIADFEKDSKAQEESGNKAAGVRARKTSLAIEKLLKEFRKVSVAEAKN